MRRTTTRWICDNPTCPATSIIDENQVPDGWMRLRQPDVDVCCQSCLGAMLKPWYDDLCVEVSLANVVKAKGDVTRAISSLAAVGGFHTTMHHEDGLSARHVTAYATSRDKMVIATVDGVILRRKPTTEDIERSPHSIVKLICPTFAQACEHPAEFLAMYRASIQIHCTLSEAGQMSRIANKLLAVHDAFKGHMES